MIGFEVYQMDKKVTEELASEILSSIQFMVDAHIHHPKTEKDTVRFWDNKTPYIIHPTWCAMTLLTETTLPEQLRFEGYQALLWHDVLEDTTMTELPEGTSDMVHRYVQEMTFNNFSEEINNIWSKDKEIQLFKLYDKTSNLLDGKWMNENKWNQYVEFTLQLMENVREEYGELNIVKIAKSIAQT